MKKTLKLIGRWFLDIGESDDHDKQTELVKKLAQSSFLQLLLNNTTKTTTPSRPSFFLVSTVLRLCHVNVKKLVETHHKITSTNCKPIGEALGEAIWKSRTHVQQNKKKLETPSSLSEYQNGFPDCISGFMDGLITIIQKKKHEVATAKRIQRKLEKKPLDTKRITRISVFLMSVILNTAFPGTNIWLTHSMSSLCRKLKLMSSLYNILCSANIVSHTLYTEI